MDSWLAGSKRQQALQRLTGSSVFRQHQAEAITAVLEGKDVMLIMATGGGKSVCFQLPPLLLNRAALIVSPTIAIMKDQVTALTQKGFSACLLGSASSSEMRLGAFSGQFQYVYATPEYLTTRTDAQLQELHAACNFCLLAMDEAHCVADMGRTFRPAFTQLHQLREAGCPLQHVPWIAVTATASPAVQMHISATLALRTPLLLCGSVERPNLHLSCHRKPCEDRAQAARMLCDIICGDPTPLVSPTVKLAANGEVPAAVVYCVSRAEVRELSVLMQADLRLKGKVGAYSAEQTAQERAQAQDAFNTGALKVLVATSAFGLGVNKPNIRWIINWGPPGDLQMYFQMIGRAGRDFQPARCMLFWSAGGISSRKYMQRQDVDAGTSGRAEANAFDALMDFVQAPKGCRHAQLSQQFSKGSMQAPGGAALDGICHGGCDVCDTRLAALRDLSTPSRHILQAIANAPDGLSQQALLSQLVTARSEQAENAEVQHVSAFWVGLLHEIMKIGLTQQVEGRAPEDAPALQLTAAGVEELAGLVRGAETTPAATDQSGTQAGVGTAALRTTRLRCSRTLVQSLLQPCGGTGGSPTQMAAQVQRGRRGLDRLMTALQDDKLLPVAFRSVLPCVTLDGTVSDMPRDVLMSFKVEFCIWACMGQVIMSLARGRDPDTVLQSEAFVAAKKKWTGSTESKGPTLRREALEASNTVQAKAVQTHKASMRARVALSKLCRKLESQSKDDSGRPITVLPEDVCDAIVKAAPQTDSELSQIPGLPGEMVQKHGQLILQHLHKALVEESQLPQPRGHAKRHSGDENIAAPSVTDASISNLSAKRKQIIEQLNPAALRFVKKKKR